MGHKHAFEAVDRSLRDIMGLKNNESRSKLFEGKTLLLGGDFRQVLLLVTKGKRQDVVQATINRSYIWDHYQVYMLTTNMRVRDETTNGEKDEIREQFNKWALDIGDGLIESKTRDGEGKATWIKIPKKYILQHKGDPISTIVNNTYQSFD